MKKYYSFHAHHPIQKMLK